MTPELEQHIKLKIAELEPIVEKAWRKVQEEDAKLEPFKRAADLATTTWCKLHHELEGLQALLK